MSTVLANTITAVGGGGSTVKVNNDSTLISEGGAVISGIVTATSYRGDGSQLTGISQVGGASTVSFNDNVPIYFGGFEKKAWQLTNSL